MKPIVFVTGKGGVGKSFVASLIAKKLALEGKKTLLVEMVSESYLVQKLSLSLLAPGTESQKTIYGFDHSVWTGEACLSDYVQFWVKVPWLRQAFLNNSWLRSLVQLAPGLREISFLGKVTSQIRKHGPPMDYDHIVIDAVSTGHFLSLMKAPQGLSEVVTAGPMKVQSDSIRDVLNDERFTETFVVTNLEGFSLHEAEDLAKEVGAVLRSPLSFIANKVYPIPDVTNEKVMGEPQAAFLSAQKSLKDFQLQSRNVLKKTQKPVLLIDFYFKPLKKVLEMNDEVRRLFN